VNIQTTTFAARPSDEEEFLLIEAKAHLRLAMDNLLRAARHYNACQHDRTLDIEAISNTFHDEIGSLDHE
jgi:hypothetical protein